MKVVLASIFALLPLQVVPAAYRPVPFPPVDEAPTSPSLKQFRSEIFDIVERRSLDRLKAVVEIRDDQSAAEAFVREFQDYAARWGQLRRALELGGAFTETGGAVHGRREFCAPYVYAAFPKEVPPYIGGENEPWAITDANVSVRSKPNARSRDVAHLSYVLVEFLDYLAGDRPDSDLVEPTWVLVAVSPQQQGWVSAAHIRSRSDWHVCVANAKDGWRISTFARDVF